MANASKVKVTVCYPRSDEATFDMGYYRTTHRDMVLACFDHIERMDIDEGIDGPYLALGHLLFPSMEALQAGMGKPEAAAVTDDIKNFTNVTPVMQVSSVIE